MKQKRVKKSKRLNKQTAMSLFVLCVMVFSIVGFGLLNAYDPGGTGLGNYEGITFTQNSDQTWNAQLQGKEYKFFYHVTNVEQFLPDTVPVNVPYLVLTSDVYKQKDVMGYVSLAKYMTKKQIEQHDVKVISAFTTPVEDQQVFTCDNASQSVPVIYFTADRNTTAITKQGNCYTLEAPSTAQLIQLRDAFMYRYILDSKK